ESNDGVERVRLALTRTAAPRVREPARWVELGDLTVRDAVPATARLCPERELVAEPRLEVGLHQPPRQPLAIGERTPHPLGRLRIDAFEPEVALHSSSVDRSSPRASSLVVQNCSKCSSQSNASRNGRGLS